jgi:hypothetical protein
MDIKWEVPPVASRGASSAVTEQENEFAKNLVRNPDRWARMRDFRSDQQGRAGNLASMIRKGERSAFRRPDLEGEFEAVSRKIPDTDITAVYVRFATLNND